MALSDHLEASNVRPVIIGFLDFKGAPKRGWTGPGLFVPSGTGDPDLDGHTFEPTAGAVEISDVTENQGLGGPVTITFLAGEMDDEDIVKEIISDQRAFMARKARIWLGFLTADESGVEPDIQAKFTGVMVGAKSTRKPGKGAVLEVRCDADLQGAQGPPVRIVTHQEAFSGDTFSTYINDRDRGPNASAEPMPLPGGRVIERDQTRDIGEAYRRFVNNLRSGE